MSSTNLKLVVLMLIELALFLAFLSFQSAAFGGTFGSIGTLVGTAVLLVIFLFWRLRNPKITPAAIHKTSSFIAPAICLGIGGFLFPLVLGPHATLGMLLLGLAAQIVCLLAASYVAL